MVSRLYKAFKASLTIMGFFMKVLEKYRFIARNGVRPCLGLKYDSLLFWHSYLKDLYKSRVIFPCSKFQQMLIVLEVLTLSWWDTSVRCVALLFYNALSTIQDHPVPFDSKVLRKIDWNVQLNDEGKDMDHKKMTLKHLLLRKETKENMSSN